MNPIFYVLDTASGTAEQFDAAAQAETAETGAPLKDQGKEAPFAERAGYAGGVTLLGMATIFIVLALLWGAIELLHRVLHRGEKNDAPAAAQAPAVPAAPAAAARPSKPAQTPAPAKTEGDALIAVITAAVAASMAEEGYTGGFRVVSFRRTQNRRSGR